MNSENTKINPQDKKYIEKTVIIPPHSICWRSNSPSTVNFQTTCSYISWYVVDIYRRDDLEGTAASYHKKEKFEKNKPKILDARVEILSDHSPLGARLLLLDDSESHPPHSLLSLPLTFMVFQREMLSVPRPFKMFWNTVITDTEVNHKSEHLFPFQSVAPPRWSSCGEYCRCHAHPRCLYNG